jgi:hypothetical protein
MITTKEILDLVRNFVKTNDLDVFSHSFAEIFYDIETTGDANAIQLANTIEGELAAVTAGVCPKSGLPDAVKSLLPTISVVIPELPALKAQEIDFMYLWGTLWYCTRSGILVRSRSSRNTSIQYNPVCVTTSARGAMIAGPRSSPSKSTFISVS